MIQWRLEVRDAHGTFRKYVTVTDPVKTLDEFGVRGDGNCLEGRFNGLAGQLGISAHDIVTLQSSADGSTWQSRHAGEVRLLPPARSYYAGQYRTVGLSERLKEAEVRTDAYAGGDAGAVVREVVSDVITTGQLGSALVYDASLIPDTGTTIGALSGLKGHALAEVLDKIASTHAPDGSGNPVTWGVNADRKLFFGVASGTTALSEGAGFQKLEWKGVAGEGTVTAVRFWLSPFLSYLASDATLVALYGERVKQVPLADVTTLITPVTGAVVANPSDTTTVASYDQNGNFEAATDPARVRDQHDVSFARFSRTVTKVAGPAFYNGPGLYVDTPNVDAVRIKATGTVTSTAAGTKAMFDTPVADVTVGIDGLYPPDGVFSFRPLLNTFPVWGPGAVAGDTATITIDVHELLGYSIDRATLDNMARAYYRAPADDPAVITAAGLVSPAPTVSLTLAGGEVVALPAESYGYRFTTSEYGVTVIRAGQADDPDEIARQQIIKARDAQGALTQALQYVNVVTGVK